MMLNDMRKTLALDAFVDSNQYEVCEVRVGAIESPMPDAIDSYATITLGSTVLEIVERHDTGLDTGVGGEWNNTNHPLVIENSALSSMVSSGSYICVNSEIMYIQNVQGTTLTIYRGRADRSNAVHGNSQTIWYYPQSVSGSVVVPLANAVTATDLDSGIKDFIKQELSITRPELKIKARVVQNGFITLFRPASVDPVKACSTTIIGGATSSAFRKQYGVTLRGDSGGAALLTRQIVQDDLDWGWFSFATDFNAIPAARWVNDNSGLDQRDVGLLESGNRLQDPEFDEEYDVQRCIFGNQVLGDWVTVLLITDDAWPDYLRGLSPDDVSGTSIQTFWGPDDHMDKPWLSPDEPGSLYSDVKRARL